MRITTVIIALFFSIILFSCAQIVPLSGGEKDEDAPKEINSIPKNGSTQFNSKTAIIEFDEYIQLKNLSSQLIVSPIMEPKPEISVKGKKLVIKLPDNLLPNTTYSINFGSAIEDITEYNTFPNYKYVFSTGDFLDSLSYSGTVVNAFDLTPQEKVYVLLYDKNVDSIPYNELPKYVALTDKEGNYELTNIAAGNYKLFALKDINSNYLFDLPNEEIGFKSDLIELTTSQKDKRIELFKEDNELQYVKKSSSKKFGEYKVEFNKPVTNFKMEALNHSTKNGSFLFESNKEQTKFTCWITGTSPLKNLDLVFLDSTEIIDTVSFDIVKKEKNIDSVLVVTPNVSSIFDLNQNLILSLKSPFTTSLKENIQLFEDSTLITTASFSNISLRKFELTYAFKENTNYQLLIPKGTFEDIYGLKNDTLIQQFKTKDLAAYGNIFLNLTPSFSETYLLQLYKGNNIVKEMSLTGTQKITFDYLLPGDYELKLIIDKNNNKKWDTGNYLEHLQPEKVIYYEKAIKIRANWDNDITWTVKE